MNTPTDLAAQAKTLLAPIAETLLQRYAWTELRPGSTADAPASPVPDAWDLWTAIETGFDLFERSFIVPHLNAWLDACLTTERGSLPTIVQATEFEGAILSTKLLFGYLEKTEDWDLFSSVVDRLEARLVSLERHPVTWLVSSGKDRPLLTLFGKVTFDGEELVPTLLLLHSVRLLERLWKRQGNQEKAGMWQDFGEMLGSGLRTLYSVDGFFYSETGRQVVRSVWGSALAVHLGLTTDLQSISIARWLRQNLSLVTFQGRIRALPVPSFWLGDKDREESEIFRALPLIWVDSAVRNLDPVATDNLWSDLLQDYAAFGVCETARRKGFFEQGERCRTGTFSSLAPLILGRTPNTLMI